MSTIKSDSIQPTSTSNNLILRTGVGDVERMRIDVAGAVSMASTLTVAGGVAVASPTSKFNQSRQASAEI